MHVTNVMAMVMEVTDIVMPRIEPFMNMIDVMSMLMDIVIVLKL